MNKYLLSVFLVVLFCGNSFGDQTGANDKSSFNLLNPTPKDMMREMSTDRPDKTESAYTVDAGHVQMEMSFFDYTYDHNNPSEPLVRVDTWNIPPTNFKLGLLNNTDLQVVLNPYIHEKTRDDGEVEKKSGFGDIETRLKVNLWGNDGGKTALAVMPFIKIPTNTDNLGNDDTEGGIIIPLAIKLPAEWSMGVMAEVDINKNSEDDNYHEEYIQSITFGHSIIGELSGYMEFFSNVSTEDGAKWVATVDAGLTYGLTKDIQLDMGVNVGVTEAADDLNPFCGISMRF